VRRREMEEMRSEPPGEVLKELLASRGVGSDAATARTLLALAQDGELLAVVDILELSEPEMMRLAVAYTYGY